MRAILVGVAVVMVGAAGPVLAGGNVADESRAAAEVQTLPAPEQPMPDAGIHQSPPFEGIVEEESHSAGEELAMGVGATIFSLIYSPIRMVVGIAGAELGGIAGWSTGGDVRTARSVWRPTVEGNYYITPDHFDGERQFRFSNLEPVIRETNSAIGRDTIATGCDGRACDGTGARSSVHDDYLHPAPAPAQP